MAVGNYQNRTLGFSFAPPEFEALGNTAVTPIASFSLPTRDGFAANINIQLHKLKLDAFIASSDTQLKSVGWEVVSQKLLKVGTRDAFECVYTGTLGPSPRLKFIAWAIESGDDVVLITGTSLEKHFDEYEATFRKSLSTLTFGN